MSARGRKVVVVGNGMAGFRFVQELVQLAPGLDVTVVGDEPGGAYNRARLPLLLDGAAREDSIALSDEGWYERHRVLLVTAKARRIDRDKNRLELDDGGTIPYDVLVLAVGAAPVLPHADGLTGPDGLLPFGAVAFRTLADTAAIKSIAPDARHAVVLGGGVLGLETASGLAAGGLPVTLVQRSPRLMERQLDAGAARVLSRTARALGVAVRAGTSVARVTTAAGRLAAVTLDDGTELPAGLLVLCCGTRPRTELARAAGLAFGTGIVVDGLLRSVTDQAVYAIGDCAEHDGRVSGLVAQAWAQARTAARSVASLVVAGQPGEPQCTPARGGHAAAPDVVRLKASGIELAVLGSPRGGSGADVVRFTDPARGVYQKLVVRDGRLAGAILLGDTRSAGTLTQLLDRGAALPAERWSLLAGSGGAAATAVTESPVAIPGHATICQCNGVTKAAICAAWQRGARDAGQVAASTRAATGCGTCREAVEGVVAWLAAAEPDAGPDAGPDAEPDAEQAMTSTARTPQMSAR